MVEYAIIAACLALPLLAIAATLSTTAGNTVSAANSNLNSLGKSPP